MIVRAVDDGPARARHVAHPSRGSVAHQLVKKQTAGSWKCNDRAWASPKYEKAGAGASPGYVIAGARSSPTLVMVGARASPVYVVPGAEYIARVCHLGDGSVDVVDDAGAIAVLT